MQLPVIPWYWTVGALGLSVVAAYGVYRRLVRQWTHRREAMEMLEWARRRGLRVRGPRSDLPEEVKVLLGADGPAAWSAGRVGRDAEEWVAQIIRADGRHNIAASRLEEEWPACGLRPVIHASSLLDGRGMESYPVILPPVRFELMALREEDALRLAARRLAALVPADVGVLVDGRWLVLDFSSRRFDTIELERMLGLLRQAAAQMRP